MNKKIKLSPFLKNLSQTFIVSVISIISNILVLRLLTQALGPEEFGAYSLARKIVYISFPFITLSMGVALPRYISLHIYDDKKKSFFIAGCILSIGLSMIIVSLAFLLGEPITEVIFLSDERLGLFKATLFMLMGVSIFTIVYASYRGQQNWKEANLLQLLSVVVGPVVTGILALRMKDTTFVILSMALFYYLALISLFRQFFSSYSKTSFREIKKAFRELLSYGLPRTPGDIALAGLLSFGVFVAPYFGSLKDAGYFLVGQSLFPIMDGFVVAFGLVMLPKVAQYVGTGEEDFLKGKINDIISFIFQIGLFVSIQLYLITDNIIPVWLGDGYKEAIPLMMLLVPALVPYLAYVMLRSIIDAVEKRALNTMNLCISLGITAATSLLFAIAGFGVFGLAIGMTVGMITLGGLSLFFLVRKYQLSLDNLQIVNIVVLNLIFAAIIVLVKNVLGNINLEIRLIAILISQVFLLLVYITILRRIRVTWLYEIEKRIFID